MFVFWKIWSALFSLNTRFQICPFALLTTKTSIGKIILGLSNVADYETSGWENRKLVDDKVSFAKENY